MRKTRFLAGDQIGGADGLLVREKSKFVVIALAIKIDVTGETDGLLVREKSKFVAIALAIKIDVTGETDGLLVRKKQVRSNRFSDKNRRFDKIWR